MLPRDSYELCEALAEDLDQLIRLHDRELDAGTLASLQACGFPENLALAPEEGAELLREAMISLSAIDVLAADYAAIYLTGALGASPCESVWVSDEHLNCDAPMFELADLYATHGLVVADRRQRYDDHLVCQLLFLRHLLLRAPVAVETMTILLDEHLCVWIGDFAARVAARSGSSFYAGLALLTTGWLHRVRDLLVEFGDSPRPSRESVEARLRARRAAHRGEIAPIRFVPGTGPVV
jgi:TorA maturation chaperone TorD